MATNAPTVRFSYSTQRPECSYEKVPGYVVCNSCAWYEEGFVRQPCRCHKNVFYLEDVTRCPECNSKRLQEVESVTTTTENGSKRWQEMETKRENGSKRLQDMEKLTNNAEKLSNSLSCYGEGNKELEPSVKKTRNEFKSEIRDPSSEKGREILLARLENWSMMLTAEMENQKRI